MKLTLPLCIRLDSSVTFCEDQVAPDIGSQNSIAGIEVVTFRPISTTEIQFRGYITELIISVCQLLVRLDETLVLIPFSSLSLLSISHAVVRQDRVVRIVRFRIGLTASSVSFACFKAYVRNRVQGR